MVKVIPWTTVCPHCNVKLEFFNEDKKYDERYDNVYITCPACGKKVVLY